VSFRHARPMACKRIRYGHAQGQSMTNVAVVMSAAVLLDAILGEPRRYHPLVGFGHVAQRMERRLNTGDETPTAAQLRGAFAVATLVVVPTLACALLMRLPGVRTLIEILVLYLAVGHRSLREHALLVHDALSRDDLPSARASVGRMVSRDTADMDASRAAGAAIESVLENGNDAIFGALFWFALLGAPGALAYRLVNTLDAMWGYRTPPYLHFGRAAARLDDTLNFVPARLTALCYALCGRTCTALRCWRHQARAWESPNAGPVMAAGAGALGIRLGGGAYYHGRWKERPTLGEGCDPEKDDIVRALRLVLATLGIWIAAAWMTTIWSWS